LQACLRGEIADRTPVALWRHFPVDDQGPETLAEAQLTFQHTYDFDLVKVTPASSFSVKDWGAEDIWEGSTEGTRRYSKSVVQRPADWERLDILEPSATHLAAQIACLRQIRAGLGPEVPILQTVFSPLSQAKHLAGETTLQEHLRGFPGAVEKGLETIAVTTQRFIRAAVEAGIDGIFYAVQHAQAAVLSYEEFARFGRVWDMAVLGTASDLWCNMLHLHGRDVYFNEVLDYPAQIINWHDRETGPSLEEARRSWKGALCGGLGLTTLVYERRASVLREAEEALALAKGRGLILSTGCVIPVITPLGNIRAARESVERQAGAHEQA
jgi:uroporphyrinogen decarboxylase